MTDQLPECNAITDDPKWDNCICDQLRACEKRVLAAIDALEKP